MSTPNPRHARRERANEAPRGLRGRPRRLLGILHRRPAATNSRVAQPALAPQSSATPRSTLDEMNAIAATYLHAWSIGDTERAHEIAGVCDSAELVAGLTVVGLSLNQVAAAHLGMTEIDAAAAGRDLAVANNLNALISRTDGV